MKVVHVWWSATQGLGSLVGRRVSYSTSACSCLLSTDLGMFGLVRAELGISRELGISNSLEQNGAFEGAPGRLLPSLTTCASWLNWGSYELGIACRR